MQRLTLILSDLYLPEEATQSGSLPTPLDLPNLDWLLSRLDAARRIRDWRHWLAAEVGESLYARIPEAQACEMEFLNRGRGSGWLASPVQLEARLDHVRLTDRGILNFDAAERAAWCTEFAGVFGPQYSLHDIGGRAFLLTGIAPTPARSQDPARLLGSDIAAALPRGPESAELRRLSSEIEMWLHRAPLNDERESARKPRVSALWLWGGGRDESDAGEQEPAIFASQGQVSFHGDDAFLVAMAQAFDNMNQRKVHIGPTPESLGAMGIDAEHAFVELTPMSGPVGQSLTSLEEKWFAAARHALESGALSLLEIVANDRCFRITPRARWRFWRPRHGWLEILAHPLRKPQA